MTPNAPRGVRSADFGISHLSSNRQFGDLVTAVAYNIKRIRASHQLSQAELARQSNIAKATLSALELGRANPTIETLFGLAKVLNVPLGSLLEDFPPAATRVSRAMARPIIDGTAVDMSLTDSFTAGSSLFETYLIHVRRERQEVPPHAAGVHERILVTQGRLLTGPVSDPVLLGPGDYICFAADRPHLYEARHGLVTATLVMSYPRGSEAA